MRVLDRLLQRWRIRKAVPWIRPGDRLLDIGCYDRSLIDRVGERVDAAVGVDVDVSPVDDGKVRLLRGRFPDDFSFDPGSFDCVTSLAVLEHVDDPNAFARACHLVLAGGGRVVLTVPHPFVDRILAVLLFLRLIEGIHVEEHHGFDVAETVPILERTGLRLVEHRRFQLGLNHLFVFEKL